MKQDTNGKSSRGRPTRIAESPRPLKLKPRTNEEIHGIRQHAADRIEGIPTLKLIAELARREELALRLAIEDALATET